MWSYDASVYADGAQAEKGGRVGEDADISGSDRVLQLSRCECSFGYLAGRCVGAQPRRKGEAC